MGYLSSLLPGVQDYLSKRAQAALYLNDPVAWAQDYLGIQLWAAQREILYSIRDNRATAVAAGHGVGKDLTLDTPLPTPAGWTTMGEVQPGDYLLDESGLPTRVLTKSEVFHHDLYKITFSDGAEITASGTHLWDTIQFAAGKKARRSDDGVRDWRDHWDCATTKNTLDIAETLTARNGQSTTANHIIPINRALDLPDADLPIDPYILGAWLGDGTSSSAAMTVGNDGKFIVDEFAAKGVELKQMLTSDSRGYAYSFARQGFRAKLREIGVFKNKHIPGAYLRASIAQRQELLRGILDTDGFHHKGSAVGCDLANETLTTDLGELVRSLGMKVNVNPGNMYLGSEIVGTRWRLCWQSRYNPFTEGTPKWGRWTSEGFRDPRTTMRNIVSVEKVESVPSQCVSVDSPRNLYLATKWMIPTHNTYLAAVAVAWWVDVHPNEETFVASTAPSADQVSLLWDNIRNMHTLAKQRYDLGLIDHPMPGHITGDNKWKLANGALIGQGRKPPEQKSDVAFQGRHAVYLLAIGDEAVGLSPGFLNALGVIATGQFNRQLLIANPTDPTCAMAKIWERKAELEKKGEESAWYTMHISVMDSPRIKHEEGFDLAKAEGISGMEFVKDSLEQYGTEDDPRYQARVLGQWAFEQGNNLFTEEDIAHASNAYVLPDPEGRVELGCDIARMGEDSSIVYVARPGDVWTTNPETGARDERTDERGIQVRFKDAWHGAPLTGGTPENPGTSERIHAIALAVGATVVKVDAAGLGAGVIDGLAVLNTGQYAVVEVFGSASPTDKRAYTNTRAEQYFSLKKRMYQGKIDLDPKDEKLFEELRGVLYEFSSRGAQKIESKDDMKRRGVKSPDRADAYWYAAMDTSIIFDAPMAGVRAGDQVMFDPFGWSGSFLEDPSLPV